MESKTVWKVGELAKALGISVRTLHHYDDLGLLQPSAKSAKGYRLYSFEDIAKLRMIFELKGQELTLKEIRERLEGQQFSSQNKIVSAEQLITLTKIINMTNKDNARRNKKPDGVKPPKNIRTEGQNTAQRSAAAQPQTVVQTSGLMN